MVEREIYDPATESFSALDVGSMSTAREEAVAAQLPDGDVLIVGGFDGRDALSSAELFDPTTEQFSGAGLGPMTTGRMQAGAAPLRDGDVLIAGGAGAGGELSSAEVLELVRGSGLRRPAARTANPLGAVRLVSRPVKPSCPSHLPLCATHGRAWWARAHGQATHHHLDAISTFHTDLHCHSSPGGSEPRVRGSTHPEWRDSPGSY